MMGKWRYLGDVKLLTSDNDRDVFLNNHLIIIIAHGASITGKYGPYAATSNLLIADARYENSMVHVNELPHDYHRKTSYDFNGENLFVWGDIWQERLVFIEYNLDTKQLKLLYSGGRPVTNPYQAGYELPNNVYLHPSIPNILGFENTDGFHLLNLETEEVIATGEQFERWIGENRLLVWQGNEFIYDYVISPDNDGVSGLDWPTPEIRVEPSIISIDEKFMLVSAFGEFDNLSPLWLVDLGTRERLSGEIIINKPDNTLVTWIWQDDNTGIVEFYQDDHHRKTIARWHIHIDALNEGQS